MNIQKIIWKIKLTTGTPDTVELFRFFNSIIDESPQVFVDVADYKHVPNGPLVVLVGVNADVGYETENGEFFLVYYQKQFLEGSNAEKLKETLFEMLAIYNKLSQFEDITEPPRLDFSDFCLIFNDRALVPNNSDTFQSLKPELLAFFGSIEGCPDIKVEQMGSPRERLKVKILFPGKKPGFNELWKQEISK